MYGQAQYDYLVSTLGRQSILMEIGIQGARIALAFIVLASVASAAKGQSGAATTAVLPVPTTSEYLQERTVASPPEVNIDYHDGQLTINAQNSSLAEVLRQVAYKTGASITLPPGSGLEHIVEHAGPGPIKSVMEHLLNGSSFNFIIINSPQNSDPRQILLTLQHSATPQVAPQPTQATTSSVLWTPPDTTERAIPLSAERDDTLLAPKEAMTPEALSEFMRQKQRELREKAQQQYPQ